MGSACTSVVTEYRQKRQEHTAPITIEVEYLSPSEIEDVIKELLWSYRQLYLPGAEGNNTSAQDYARYQRESAQAWSALGAAFKLKRGFREDMLQDMSEGALERLTARLIEWSREIKWPGRAGGGLWRSTADTAEECVEKTGLFMEDQYWPFTKIIRVYVSAQVLKTGIVLADLPGKDDAIPPPLPALFFVQGLPLTDLGRTFSRPARHKPRQGARNTRLPAEMQPHLHRRQHLPGHHGSVTPVVALLGSFAPRAVGVGGVGSPELKDCRCVHQDRGTFSYRGLAEISKQR